MYNFEQVMFYCIISSQYICVSVKIKYTSQMSTLVLKVDMLGPTISENDPPFLLHWSLRPTNFEKNLKPYSYSDPVTQEYKKWLPENIVR